MIRRDALCVDREQVQQDVHEIIDVVVRLVLLHLREQCHDDLAEIWLRVGLTEYIQPVQHNQSDEAHAQRGMQHDALQELKAPPVVCLAWQEPLLRDA